MRTPTLAVWVQLPLGWKDGILICFSRKTGVGLGVVGEEKENIFLFFGGALILSGQGLVGWGRKSYIGPAEIASFLSRDFNRSNKHATFWHVRAGYFYVLFLWAIAVSDFCPLEIYKNLSLPLSCRTFTVNSHADNHFYKYIYFKYTIWNQFFLLKVH